MRRERPDGCHSQIPKDGLDATGRRVQSEGLSVRWMRKDKECQGGCGPEPADFDKVEIEDVSFPGKVGRRQGRRLVGLVRSGVGGFGCEDGWRESSEEGAGYEGKWVD